MDFESSVKYGYIFYPALRILSLFKVCECHVHVSLDTQLSTKLQMTASRQEVLPGFDMLVLPGLCAIADAIRKYSVSRSLEKPNALGLRPSVEGINSN